MIAQKRDSATRRRPWIAAVLGLGLLATLSLASPATAKSQAVPLPTPKDFVSNLDLECYKTSAYTPPAVTILTRHINPLLTTLPSEVVTLGQREQLCVPVAKNGVHDSSD